MNPPRSNHGALVVYVGPEIDEIPTVRTKEEERESMALRTRERARAIVCRIDPERLRSRRKEIQ